jgi:hypothetical protein
MRAAHIACAILACAPLSFEARAIASTEAGRPSQPQAHAGPAAGPAAPDRDASARSRGTPDPEPNRAHPPTGSGSTGGGSRGSAAAKGPARGSGSNGSGSKGRDAAGGVSPRRGSATPAHGAAQSKVAQAGRANADRLHSLLSARAQGHLVRQPGRAVGSPHGAAGSPAVRGSPPSTPPPSRPKLAVANPAPAPAARPAVIPRSPGIGGPHAQVSGRVGGPAVGRTTGSATVNGAQMRHKF